MKIEEVVEEANKKIIDIKLFMSSYFGVFLMNIFILMIGSIIALFGIFLNNNIDNIILKSAFYFILFLTFGIIYIAISYGIVAYIYKLSNNEDVKIIDIFKNAILKIGIVIKVFLRVICKFFIQIILLIVSGIVMITSFIAAIILFVSEFFEGFYVLLAKIFSTESIDGFQTFISKINVGIKEMIGLFVISLIIFIVTAVFMFIKRMSYSLTDFLICENNEDNSRDIVEKSEELMNGKKLIYFGIIMLPVALSIGAYLIFELIKNSNLLITILYFFIGMAITTYSYILQVAFYRLAKK